MHLKKFIHPPAYAASTCNHMSNLLQTGPIDSKSSILQVPVEPNAATTCEINQKSLS